MKRIKLQNQHVLNVPTDILITNIELLRFLNYHAKFEIDRTNLTCLKQRKELTVTDRQTNRP